MAAVPPTSKLLDEKIGAVTFPNYAGKFGWKAVGTRTDEIDGRDTRTVFYEKDGKRIAYTVVDGDALSKPDDADKATREGTELRSLTTSDDRTVVTWERNGQTCVLSVVEGRRLARRAARARRLEGHGRGRLLERSYRVSPGRNP